MPTFPNPPRPVDPATPFEVNPVLGDSVVRHIREVQRKMAERGYAILGAVAEPMRDPNLHVDSRRLLIVVAPATPLAAMHGPGEGVVGPQKIDRFTTPIGPAFSITRDALEQASRSTWSEANTIVAPRGALAWALERKIWFDDGQYGPPRETADLNFAIFTRQPYEGVREFPRLSGNKKTPLLDTLRRYCHEQGHRIEYAGAWHGRFATVVINPSHAALIDMACRTQRHQTLESPHQVTTDSGVWEVNLLLSPRVQSALNYCFPRVLVEPTGHMADLFDQIRRAGPADVPPRTEANRTAQAESNRNGARVFRPLQGAIPSTLHYRSVYYGLRWLWHHSHRGPDPVRWVDDLARCQPAGDALARLIRMEVVSPEDREMLYRELRDVDLVDEPWVPRDLDADFAHALAHPPQPEAAPAAQAGPSRRIQPVHQADFRL